MSFCHVTNMGVSTTEMNSDTDSEGDHDSEGETTDMYWSE
jgi:hypothetical protein